jgi:hypothetical protein
MCSPYVPGLSCPWSPLITLDSINQPFAWSVKAEAHLVVGHPWTCISQSPPDSINCPSAEPEKLGLI